MSKIIRDYHLHTNLCDGKNSPEEMILSAIEKGMKEIGFSGHSYLPFDPDWNMSEKNLKEYLTQLQRLKAKYKNDISVKIGLEQDFDSPSISKDEFDYIIGSVHCLFKKDKYIPIDYSPEILKKAITKFYENDPIKMAEDYFGKVAKIYEVTGCNIVGHFDLITKFQEKEKIFNEKDPRYIKAWEKALESLSDAPVAFEINTGAISRGYRTTPYPNKDILFAIKEMGKPVILSSDAHDKEGLLFEFEKAEKIVNEIGLELIEAVDQICNSK